MENWKKLLAENNKQVNKERCERKTLEKGDWIVYGPYGTVSGFGQIGWISNDKKSCAVKKSQRQKEFHDCYWTVNPHVTKMPTLRAAAERYYAWHRTGDILSSGYPRSDFEMRIHRDCPSYYEPLETLSLSEE